MKQNKYDEPEFFASYSAMPRSVGGLDQAGEWHAFRALLPSLAGKRVLDLGCGFGWHCRYARKQGARSVLGVDLSERMLERARAMTDDSAIEYRLSAIEDLDLPPESFDAVISSLAFHYVDRFDLICRQLRRCLTSGGSLVFSVEHPIFTALASQDWHCGSDGERLHWPVDDYSREGERRATWLTEDVVKYHRTLATYVNNLIDAGFRIARLSEPEPTPEMLRDRPDLADEVRRPMFLLIAAIATD